MSVLLIVFVGLVGWADDVVVIKDGYKLEASTEANAKLKAYSNEYFRFNYPGCLKFDDDDAGSKEKVIIGNQNQCEFGKGLPISYLQISILRKSSVKSVVELAGSHGDALILFKGAVEESPSIVLIKSSWRPPDMIYVQSLYIECKGNLYSVTLEYDKKIQLKKTDTEIKIPEWVKEIATSLTCTGKSFEGYK